MKVERGKLGVELKTMAIWKYSPGDTQEQKKKAAKMEERERKNMKALNLAYERLAYLLSQRLGRTKQEIPPD